MRDVKTLLEILRQLKYLMNKNQQKRSIYLVVLVIIGAAFETLGISAVLPFVQAILTPQELMNSSWCLPIVEWFKIENPYVFISLIGIGVILVYIIKNLYLIFSTYMQTNFRIGFQKYLSSKLLTSYMQRPYSFFLDTNSSEMIRGIQADSKNVNEILDNVFKFSAELLTVMSIGVFIIFTDPFMAAGILTLVVGCLLGVMYGFKRKVSKLGIEQRSADEMKNRYAYQAFMGNKEIKVMQRSKYFVDSYDKAAELSRQASFGFYFISSLPERIIETVCIGGLIGVVCIRLQAGIDAAIFVPKLGAFAVAAFRILPSMSRIAGYLTTMVYYRTALQAAYENLTEVEIYEREQKKYKEEYEKLIPLQELKKIEFKEKLEINKIDWKYQSSQNYVLTNLSLSINRGESVALIGASGSGKTTLADVILGLLQPENGTIEIDGRNIYTIPKQWSKIIGYVPQTIFLTDDTIRANVSFGIRDEEIDNYAIWEALEQAQLKHFVETLPNGLDTVVGERGVKFSGGQRQRIAIARALYNNPEILILDEATSALDSETENAVMESIDALQGHKTLIIVAHRLTTIRNCDKIYEIVGGRAELKDKNILFLQQISQNKGK